MWEVDVKKKPVLEVAHHRLCGRCFHVLLKSQSNSTMTVTLQELTDQLDQISSLYENLGWDTESAQNEEMVTFVKRAVVYSEVTLPKSEFIKMKNDENPTEYFEDQIETKMITDEVMKDFGDMYNKYAVFEGDISSMTDDVMSMCDFNWDDRLSDHTKIQKVDLAL